MNGEEKVIETNDNGHGDPARMLPSPLKDRTQNKVPYRQRNFTKKNGTVEMVIWEVTNDKDYEG